MFFHCNCNYKNILKTHTDINTHTYSCVNAWATRYHYGLWVSFLGCPSKCKLVFEITCRSGYCHFYLLGQWKYTSGKTNCDLVVQLGQWKKCSRWTLHWKNRIQTNLINLAVLKLLYDEKRSDGENTGLSSTRTTLLIIYNLSLELTDNSQMLL